MNGRYKIIFTIVPAAINSDLPPPLPGEILSLFPLGQLDCEPLAASTSREFNRHVSIVPRVPPNQRGTNSVVDWIL